MVPTILFIKGVRDDGTVRVISLENENMVFNVGGSSNIFNFIDNDRFKKALLTLDSKPNSSINTMGCRVMFNQISDFDTYKIALNKVSHMLQQLGTDIICINRPEKIALTTRDSISSILQGIDGLTVPHTVRIAPRTPDDISRAIRESDLELPVLIRECGRHGGDRTQLLKTIEDVDRLYAFALDGRDYYLTAFHDFAEKDSQDRTFYKKFRLAVIDGKPFIRHMIFSDDWMIHSDSRQFMAQRQDLQDEESRVLESFDTEIAPLILPAIREIQQRLQLEYFGLDCHISSDAEVLLFEANATMNMLLNNAPDNTLDNTLNNAKAANKWQQPIASIKQALIEMIMARAVYDERSDEN